LPVRGDRIAETAYWNATGMHGGMTLAERA